MGDHKIVKKCKNMCTTVSTTAPPTTTEATEGEEVTPASARIEEDSSAGGLGAGAVIGIVIGVAAAAGLAAVAIGFFVSKQASAAASPLSESLMGNSNTSPLYEAD